MTKLIKNCFTGVIGYMTFWGVRLESVSMITIIMSIGFAVDLSAHIGYAYTKAEGTKDMRAIQALGTIGWPVFLVSSTRFSQMECTILKI